MVYCVNNDTSTLRCSLSEYQLRNPHLGNLFLFHFAVGALSGLFVKSSVFPFILIQNIPNQV